MRGKDRRSVPPGLPGRITPRVRGKGMPESSHRLRDRITPACAGKSAPWAKQKGGVGDHPRVCGEKPTVVATGLARLGSPPRVRGKVKNLSL